MPGWCRGKMQVTHPLYTTNKQYYWYDMRYRYRDCNASFVYRQIRHDSSVADNERWRTLKPHIGLRAPRVVLRFCYSDQISRQFALRAGDKQTNKQGIKKTRRDSCVCHQRGGVGRAQTDGYEHRQIGADRGIARQWSAQSGHKIAFRITSRSEIQA